MEGVKMTNESVKQELKELVERMGIKQIFLAKQFSLSSTTISYFMRDMRDLNEIKLEMIHEFCEENS